MHKLIYLNVDGIEHRIYDLVRNIREAQLITTFLIFNILFLLFVFYFIFFFNFTHSELNSFQTLRQQNNNIRNLHITLIIIFHQELMSNKYR